MISCVYAGILNVPSTDYPTIQSAINACPAGDTVLVQPEEYVENLNFFGKNIVVGSLFLTTNDTMYIGQTILNGNNNILNQGCVVLFVNGENESAQLTGFTISGGYYSGGGGIQCAFNSSPSLSHLVITGNTAGNGGGIYCFDHANPVISDVQIYGNAAIYKGGGICCEQFCSPLITRTLIRNNAANEDGGGLYFNNNSSAELSDIVVAENSCSWAGGGIFCADSSDIQLKNSTIRDNSTEDQAGGLYCQNSNPYLERVTITGNSAWEGGGLYCAAQARPLLVNLTVSDNQAAEQINGNYAGGGLFIWNSRPELVNTIFWNDSKPEIYLLADIGAFSGLAVAASDISGGQDSIYTSQGSTVYWLEKNINIDPLFVNPTTDDYRLQLTSICRDAGIQDVQLAYNSGLDTLTVPALSYLDAAPDLGASESGITSVPTFAMQTPLGYRLEQNYPNPFNATTNFRFSIPAATRVVIDVYNPLGQKVMTLLDSYLNAGVHQVRAEINNLATGIYLYQIRAGSFVQSRKMILLR